MIADFRRYGTVVDLVLVAVVVWLLYHAIVPLNGYPRALVLWDSVDFAYPLLAFINRCYRAGTLPSWNPFSFAGAPFLGNLQAHPFNPLDAAAALTGRLSLSRFQLLLALQIAVGSLGMYAWGRARTGSRLAGLIGAVAFAGCGSVVNYVSHYTLLSALCLFPYPFVAFEVWDRDRRPMSLVLVTLSLAAWLVTTYPSQTGYYCVAFAVFYAVRRARMAHERSGLKLILLEVAAFAVCPIALSAVHLLPAMLMIPLVPRGHGIAFGDMLRANGWMHPAQMWSVLLPNVATAPSVFEGPDITLRDLGLGVVPVFLAVLALMRLTRGRVLLAAAAVVCADLMLGPRSLLLPAVHRFSILTANSFYPIVDFGTLLEFAILGLAIDGAADVVQEVPTWKWWAALIIVAAACVAFYVWGSASYPPSSRDDPVWRRLTISYPALCIAVLFAARFFTRERRGGHVVQAVVILIGTFAGAAIDTLSNAGILFVPVAPELFSAQAQAYAASEPGYFALPDKWPRTPMFPELSNEHLLTGVPTDWGYDSTHLTLHESAMHNPAVRAVLLDSHRAWVADEVVAAADAAAVPLFRGDRRVAAFVRLPPEEFVRPHAPAGPDSIDLLAYGADEVTYRVVSPRPEIVVFNELAVAGWTMAIDDAPREMLVANGYFRAAAVPSGVHIVRFRYRTPGLLIGAVMLVAGLAATATVAVAAASTTFARRTSNAA